MNTQKLTVGLIQQRCSADACRNLDASIEGIRKATARGARLVLLPELHGSLYFCQTENTSNFDLAETIPGPTTERLGKLAAEHGVVIVASIFEKRAAGLYHNTAVAIESDGCIAGCYRKMHIPDDPGYYEKFYFTPGDLGFNPVKTSVGTLGMLVCWDQWYPEAARLMTLGGAQILLYPTAIGWSPVDTADEQARQRDAWLTIQRAHAIANGLSVLTCNRTGFEADDSGHTDGIQFWGSSAVFGPQGEILEQATENEAGIVVATIDLQRTEQVRRLWPYLRDRRIDAYQDLLRRYRD
jgi:N-carbamoylputrescine amidase